MPQEVIPEKHSQGKSSILLRVFLYSFLVLLLPFVLLWAVLYLTFGAFLYAAIWFIWCARGREVLFVYSDSPIWRDYVYEKIFPALDGRAVILNWSERKHWKPSLATYVLKYFSISREFNPIALVFKPFRLVRSFKFYTPFKDYKHGHTEGVERMKDELFQALGIQT
jgi:hypothetical protein